jgi:diguanylate cyclase (GGDEF)-like protein
MRGWDPALAALLEHFLDVARARTKTEAVVRLLRATHDPLCFSRAIYLSGAAEAGAGNACWEIDGGRLKHAHQAPLAWTRAGTLHARFARGASLVTGAAADATAPLEDTRCWYAMLAIEGSGGLHGILYADGHPSEVPTQPELATLASLAKIASVALEHCARSARLHELATRDPLTGVLNRRAFGERLATEIEASRRYGRALTYVLIDLDDLKRINDSLGHAHGDAVLQKLADVLTANSRAEDAVGRYAGDEFTALLTNCERQLASDFAARLLHDLRRRGLSCSLGAATFPRDAAQAGDLLVAADRALYAAKRAGKNRVAFASAASD